MMSGVPTQIGDEYTWLSAPGTWAQSVKPWEMMYPVSWAVDLLETLQVVDTASTDVVVDLRRGLAVISDIVFKDTEMTDESFLSSLRRGAPVGYGSFRPYVPGDYQIERAMMRFVVESSGSDQLIFHEMTVLADMPDIFDRGRATLIADVNRIEFIRTYTTAPEVTANFYAGLSSGMLLPKIVAITKDYFEVVLEDRDELMQPGEITWTSIGY